MIRVKELLMRRACKRASVEIDQLWRYDADWLLEIGLTPSEASALADELRLWTTRARWLAPGLRM